jgi:phosphatidylglycerophosphatase C
VNRPAAFFDFDGTLTVRDSLIPFLRWIRGTSRFVGDLLVTSPWLGAYAVGFLGNESVKERLLTQTLRGSDYDYLCHRGEEFAHCHIPHLLRADTVARLRAHQQQGHCCVLVSASLEVYLKPWAKSMGFEYCLASSLVRCSDDRVTGALQDGNCYGEEKVRRIQSLLNHLGDAPITYAYGNSKGDFPMLSVVDKGYLIKKNGRVNRYSTKLQKR